jgi:uncharacterized protein GlcG (DUF336 family)
MSELTLAQASTIVEAALEHAAGAGLKPLAVAVLDRGGALVAFKKQDGASLLRYEIAFGKAYGALALGAGSRAVAAMAEQRPAFIGAAIAASQGRMIPVPGGVLIHAADGALLGAVGISGDMSDNDEACGVAGITAAGLIAATGG